MTKGKKKIPKPFHLPSTLTVTKRKHLPRKVRKSMKNFYDEDKSPYKIGRFIFTVAAGKGLVTTGSTACFCSCPADCFREEIYLEDFISPSVSSLCCLLMIVSMLSKKDMYLFGRQIKAVVPQLAQKPY